jgi:hypothetical protein
MNREYERYRKNKIESGQLYQDFVVDCCWSLLGLAVVQYTSKLYQHQVGESKTGLEIKNDEQFRTTGNLYIELSEKARPRPGTYAASGINRGDNTWLYAIGDYDTIFIFPKTLLLMLRTTGRYREVENKTKTSNGMLLPVGDATKYAAQILHPNATEKIGKAITDLQSLGRELHEAAKKPINGQLDLFDWRNNGGSL